MRFYLMMWESLTSKNIFQETIKTHKISALALRPTCLTKTKHSCQELSLGQLRSHTRVYMHGGCYTYSDNLPLMHSHSHEPGWHLCKVLSEVSAYSVSVAKEIKVHPVPLWDHGLSKSNFKLMWSLWLWIALHESMNLGIHWVGHLGTGPLICTLAGFLVCSPEQ